MVALLAAALASLCLAQPQGATTENQARYYVYGAFLTHAVPEIMGEQVALGPELQQRLGLAGGADRRRVYDALMSYTDGKRLSVRRATADEISRYRPQAKRDLKAPTFAVQADDITLLVEYDMQANTIPFVGQLSVAYQAPAAPPIVEQRAAPPPPVAAPKPAAPPPVPVVATPKPPAPAVAVAAPKPAPAVAPAAPKAAPVAPKPQARVAAPPPRVVAPPVEPELRPNGPCEVKPVMTEQDLVNCRAGAPIAPRVDPGSPPAARPQVRAAPQQPARRSTTSCEIKPVMSEEDLIACGIRR